VGLSEGTLDGIRLGWSLGSALGLAVGLSEGTPDGIRLGWSLGSALGLAVGLLEGTPDGIRLGLAVGSPSKIKASDGMGEGKGPSVGASEGASDGSQRSRSFGGSSSTGRPRPPSPIALSPSSRPSLLKLSFSSLKPIIPKSRKSGSSILSNSKPSTGA
jgi:hypothetical protein